MNFAYGIIAIVGILAAISIGFIAISPNDVIEPRVIDESQISESITSVEESIVKVPMTLIISLPAGSGVPGCDETNECFLPYDTTIGVGGTITWSNDDSAAHTVTVFSWQVLLLNLHLMKQELMITFVWFILG